MINLLPPEVKEEYHYARRNTRLVRWTVMFGVALIGLVVISFGGILYLDQQAKQYDSQIESLQTSLKQQNQAKTTKEVTEISNDLKLAVQVLSKQVLYSKMLTQLATVIPGNAVLANLNLDQSKGALDLTANATDYTAATQLQVNLSDPSNKLFSRADIVNIACASAGDTSGGSSAANSKYPCTVTVRALFADKNPYLFITNSKDVKR